MWHGNLRPGVFCTPGKRTVARNFSQGFGLSRLRTNFCPMLYIVQRRWELFVDCYYIYTVARWFILFITTLRLSLILHPREEKIFWMYRRCVKGIRQSWFQNPWNFRLLVILQTSFILNARSNLFPRSTFLFLCFVSAHANGLILSGNEQKWTTTTLPSEKCVIRDSISRGENFQLAWEN